MTLKVQILEILRLFIILVGLTMTLFSEKMLISTRCLHGSMSNLIKKSWTDSRQEVWYKANHKRAEQTYKGVSNAAELAFIKGDDIQGWCCLRFYFTSKPK